MSKPSVQICNALSDQLREKSDNVILSMLQNLGYSHNCLYNTKEPLGEAMYNLLKQIILIANEGGWELDQNEWKDWVEEVFEELGYKQKRYFIERR